METLKAALPPEALDALRAQARREVGCRRLPAYLLERQVEHEVETQLMQTYGVASFEV